MPYCFKVQIPGQWLNFSVVYKSIQTKTKLLLGFYQDLQKGETEKQIFYVYVEEDYCKPTNKYINGGEGEMNRCSTGFLGP